MTIEEVPSERPVCQPALTAPGVVVFHGDCLDVLAGMADNSIDAIVTDPPYGLGLMGKEWDDLPPGLPWAQECLRVLKPGGHMLAFGASRTWHRLTVAVEDAGFEIRDSIAWLNGSGFPKSLNLTDDAGERTGWGTALKPAFEPIVVARKPLIGTVTANVHTFGTGALNIDGCRVETRNAGPGATLQSSVNGQRGPMAGPMGPINYDGSKGRWPTNVILDGSQADALDAQSGILTSGANPTRRGTDKDRSVLGAFAGQADANPQRGTDTGGASRFFPIFRYQAKAPKSERPKVDGVTHTTVKPLALMRWMVRLVTPPGGTVLDTFAGSGTTLEAAILEGFSAIGIEREADYLPLIEVRLARAVPYGHQAMMPVELGLASGL